MRRIRVKYGDCIKALKYGLLLIIVLILTRCKIEPKEGETAIKTYPAYYSRYTIPIGAIPFNYDGHIVFSGVFNDTIKAKWAYDTGSPMTVIDSSFYAENGYSISKYIPTSITGGGNNRAPAYIVEEDCKIGVEDEEVDKRSAFLIDLREAVGDKKADGILDLCFFGKSIYEINYEHNYLLIHDINFTPDSSWTSIPFEFWDKNRIVFDAWVEIEPGKRITGPFLLDLGSSGSFGITSYSAETAELSKSTKDINIMDLKNAGIGGNSTIALLDADMCGVGPYTFENVQVTYSTNVNGAFGSRNHNGIVGNRIFSRFDLIIDYVNLLLYLKPNKYYEKEFRNNPGLGFSLIDRTLSKGGFEVNGIIRDSKADSVGLKLGDLIRSVNKERVNIDDYKWDFQRKLELLTDSGNVILEIERDSVTYHFELN